MNKRYKLTSTKAFDYVHKRGKSVADSNLVLIYAPTKYPLKVGFSVSKKVGKAVKRNRTKRRLREAFRLLIPYVDSGYNYIIIARQGSAERSYSALLESTKKLLLKANLVINEEKLKKVYSPITEKKKKENLS